MQLTIVLPDLVHCIANSREANNFPPTPNLCRLLTHAEKKPLWIEGIEAWLCHFFGILKQQDWPIAAITARHDGLTLHDAYWLRADPVFFRPSMNDLFFTHPASYWSVAHTSSFVDSLNRYFIEDQLSFFAPYPHRWYISINTIPRLRTRPFSLAVEKPLFESLPRGLDAALWRRRLNEIQMLFAVQLNSAIEQSVNGLWLWGGGIAPDSSTDKSTQLAQLLTDISDTHHLSLGNHQLLWRPMSARWQDSLAQFDHDELPFLLEKNKIAQVELVINRDDEVWILKKKPLSMWSRFRRGSSSLAELLHIS